MAVVRVAFENHGVDGAWFAGSQVPTLPACHAGDENRQRVWRSTGASTCEVLGVNVCSTSKGVDRVSFVSANFSTAAVIRIEGDCTSAFNSASLFTTCFAPWAAGRTGVTFADLSSRQTKKWWQFVVGDDSGNADGYHQLGVAALGRAACAAVDVAQEVTYQIVDPSLVSYAPSGTPKTYARAPFVLVSLPQRFLSEAVVFDTGGGFQDVIRLGGAHADMVLSVYTSAPACSCSALAMNIYGRLLEGPQFSYVYAGGLRWNATLAFRESL